MRFVIIGSQRTGSNHLVSLLNSHPEIVCYGELFRNRYDILKNIPKISENYSDINYRKSNFISLLHYLDQLNYCKTWGFKIFPEHSQKIIENLIQKNKFKIVLLQRENILAQYSSLKIAKEQKLFFSKYNSMENKNNKTQFIKEEFEKFLGETKRSQIKFKNLCIKENINFFEIDYSELNDQNKLNNLLDFLNLKKNFLRSNSSKLLDFNIIKRFYNEADCINFLKNNNVVNWSIE